jgi:hypothetical protein
MTEQEEAIENNRLALKYLINTVLKTELKASLNFKEIISAHVVADKIKDAITSKGFGVDRDTEKKIEKDAPNVLALSKNKNYEDIFIGMFVNQIEDFKELHEADLVFQFSKKDEQGKAIQQFVNTCIKYVDKNGKRKLMNFRSEL